MQACSLPLSAISSHPLSGRSSRQRSMLHTRVRASAKDDDTDGSRGEAQKGVVDENMLALRKRIREIKALDRGEILHQDWMDWEKEYCCKLYESKYLETLAMLQLQLMSERPKLAITMTVMVTLSMPTSVLIVMMQLTDVANWILNGVQHK